MESRQHAVCVPFPSQGHINALMQLAKLLHSAGFHITFVHTDSTYARILDTCGPRSLDGLPDFRFEAIADGLCGRDPATGEGHGEGLSELCGVVRKRLAAPFRELLVRLDASDGPKVSCVVSDTFSSYTLDVAAEHGVPDVSFCSLGASGFLGCFKFKELLDSGILPLKSEDDLHNGFLNTSVDWVPGKTMRLRDLPWPVRTTDPADPLLTFCRDETQDARRASAIIFNTFEELEGPALAAVSSAMPPVYAVGPLNLMCRRIRNESLRAMRFDLWEADTACVDWLDGKASGSVLYINFGSLTTMTSRQLEEFAWGIAGTGRSFLWVVRPNLAVAALPEEFLAEVAERGMIASWCEQERVLMHPAVGGFLTHCGWNSTMESVGEGVPMICWPYLGDQQTNCHYVCDVFGVGLEIGSDVRRGEVERLVGELFGGGMGVEMREMAAKWRGRAVGATDPGGNSFLNLERVIDDVLRPKGRV